MSGTRKLLWEFVPDRRNLPPVLRSLIRQPVQQVWLDGDVLTVATVDRRLGTEPENERALAEALSEVAGDRWAAEPADDDFCEIDRTRLATWT